jgi:hypothetical protein
VLPHVRSVRGALPLQLPRNFFRKDEQGKDMLAPPVGSQPLRRWARGHCQYPVDRVPPHTSFKTTQGAGRASMHCHVPYGSGPCLHAEIGSSPATCPVVLDLTSQLRWDLALPPVTEPPQGGFHQPGSACMILNEVRTQSIHRSIQYHIL